MRIKIISIHDIGTNFGSTLQACSLYDYIVSLGYEDVHVINYKPYYAYHYGKVGQLLKKILFFRAVLKQNKRFKEYYCEHCNLTQLYETFDELKTESSSDVYIVGSDQVWNEYYDGGRDPAYYLKFTDSENKMSYAASVGQLQSESAIGRLIENISSFRYVSVREQASVVQLVDAGRKDVVHVLDPVFLMDKEYYIDKAFKNIYGEYILVYVVHSDPFLDSVIEKLSEKLNAKIILVGGFMQNVKHDYYLRDIGPKEFVNLINNAKFVVANSFHATAFSILMNKQFALINPKASPLRLSDMLEVAGINNRIISSLDDIEKVLDPINYDKVNEIMEYEKKKSRTYLKNCLAEFEKMLTTP